MRYLIILLCLLIAGVANANTFGTKLGGPASGVGNGCPVGTYIAAWTGDATDGVNYICVDSGAEVLLGTDTEPVLPISTAYGDDGSNGSLHDIIDEAVTWDQAPDQYINKSAKQTIWLRLKIASLPDQFIRIFESYYSGSNYINIAINTSGRLYGYYRNSVDGAESVFTNALSTGVFLDVAYSFNRLSGDPDIGKHAVYDGSTWVDEDDEITTDIDDGLPSFSLGNLLVSATALTAGAVHIDKLFIVDGYRAAKPW